MEYVAIPKEWMEEIERKLERIERNTMPKPKAPVLGRVLSANAVAKQLGVSVQTVYKWAREGKLRATHVGGRVLFSDAAIQQFIERGTE